LLTGIVKFLVEMRIVLLVELSIVSLVEFLSKGGESIKPPVGAIPPRPVRNISSRRLLLGPAYVRGGNV